LSGLDPSRAACWEGGEGSEDGVIADYAVEDEPLGTAGAIRNAMGFLDEGPLLALNGDVLTDVDVSELSGFHRKKGGLGTIYLTPVDDPRRYGLVRLRGGGGVEEFLEKPGPEHVGRALINAGVYVLEQPVLEMIPEGLFSSIERGVFPQLAADGLLFGYASDCYWLDIGTPASYLTANFDVLGGALQTEVGDALRPAFLHISPQARIDPGARILPPAYLDDGVRVAKGARVGPLAAVGAGSTVHQGAVVQESVLHDGVRVGAEAQVRRAVLVRGTEIGAKAQVEEAIVGEACVVGAGNELARGVCLAPETFLESETLSFRDVVDGEEGR